PDHLECDHITPESLGGATTLENLMALCGACNKAKGDTIVSALPILPPVRGFGDFESVMRGRAAFRQTVKAARQRMLRETVETVRTWRADSVPVATIRDRIPALVGNRNVQKVIFQAFRGDLETMRAFAK
ncbi:MAG: HNH endonuclease, partial [Bacteroidetes bacterium]|nr:HNH endonuclease [Bacteroidota bacterium]